MAKKKLGSLVLALFLITTVYTPVQAALKEGNFVPYTAKKSAAVNARSKYYQIKKGDTLWSISQAYKTDLATLMSINNLNKNSILNIGQTIMLPGNDSRVHLIQKGETMWSIASLYDIDVKDLQMLNRDKKPNQLKIGDELAIPESIVRVVAVMAEPSRSLAGGVYSWPVTGPITSNYGWRKSGFHHGLDIAAKIGTPVKAASSGQVIFAGTRDIYGKTVIVDHTDGRQTLYAHLSKYNVKKGQQIAKGQIIAYVGNTGRTTGPHLHFAVMKGEETFDPLIFLRK